VSALTKPVDLDTRIAHARKVILLGQRPPDRITQVDAELAQQWGCAQEDVHRVFVEAWRRLCASKSEYQAVIMSQLDEVMRWSPIGKNRLNAAKAAWEAIQSIPYDPGPQKHADRVAAYRQALRDPDEALKEAMELEGLKLPMVVHGEEG